MPPTLGGSLSLLSFPAATIREASPWLAVALIVIVVGYVFLQQRDTNGTTRLYNGFRGFIWGLGRWRHDIKVKGEFKIPGTGGFLIVANHTCGADPPYVIALTPVPVSFIVAREIYETWWLKPFCTWLKCVPVNRSGNDVAAIRSAQRILENRRALAIFPEGGIKLGGLGEGKPGAALLALKAGVPIIPIFFHGTPESDVFMNAATSRAHITAYIGEPFSLDGLGEQDASPIPEESEDAAAPARRKKARPQLQAAVDMIMGRIAALRDQAFEELGPWPPPSTDKKSDGNQPAPALPAN